MQNTLLKMLVAILFSTLLVKLQISMFRRMRIGQPIQESGNESHMSKWGTPTMGGLAFTSAFILICLVLIKLDLSLLFVLLSTIIFGGIGFIDDYNKVRRNNNDLGLSEAQKLILQSALAFVLLTIFYFILNVNIGDFNIPFFKAKISLGIFSIPVLMIIMVGSINAVNFTDGLDGLLGSVSIPILLGISVISMIQSPSVSQAALVFVGVLLGYLLFNSYPASIFMGDTGSMAIGGAIVSMLIILNKPLYYIFFGAVFLIEAISVIIQRLYYKKTKKRIFKMAPIHHHFELEGFKETKIVYGFMIFSAIMTLIGMIA